MLCHVLACLVRVSPYMWQLPLQWKVLPMLRCSGSLSQRQQWLAMGVFPSLVLSSAAGKYCTLKYGDMVQGQRRVWQTALS